MWMHRDMTFSDVLVHELLLREIGHDSPRDEMKFRLGRLKVLLSTVEFCLITGLKFGELLDTSQYGEVVDGIHHKYFNLRDDMPIDNMKDALELGRFGSPNDALKLSLILILHRFLYNSDNHDMLLVWMLQLVDDLEALGAFPWGSFIYWHSILSYMLAQASRGKSYKKK
ncbi:hypothetical protein ACOSQ3_026915 [Xanthoceras sorbifolium]